MPETTKLRLYGFKETDRKVFFSLFTILSSKLARSWTITDGSPVDVVMVDIDADPDHQIISRLLLSHYPVIVFGHKEDVQQYEHHLMRPLRAADILACLDYFDYNSAESVPSHVQGEEITQRKTYKLRRWPPKSVLEQTRRSSRLCAVLMHRPISIESAADLVGISKDSVRSFIRSCQEHDCLETKTVRTIDLVNKKIDEDTAFFARMRRHF